MYSCHMKTAPYKVKWFIVRQHRLSKKIFMSLLPNNSIIVWNYIVDVSMPFENSTITNTTD